MSSRNRWRDEKRRRDRGSEYKLCLSSQFLLSRLWRLHLWPCQTLPDTGSEGVGRHSKQRQKCKYTCIQKHVLYTLWTRLHAHITLWARLQTNKSCKNTYNKTCKEMLFPNYSPLYLHCSFQLIFTFKWQIARQRNKCKLCTNVTNIQTRRQIKMTNLSFRWLREGRMNSSSCCKQVQDGKLSWSQWCSTNQNMWICLNSPHIFLVGTFGNPLALSAMYMMLVT